VQWSPEPPEARAPGPREVVAAAALVDETAPNPRPEAEHLPEVAARGSLPEPIVAPQESMARLIVSSPEPAVEVAFPDIVPTWELVDSPVQQPDSRLSVEPEVRPHAPGWQSLARPQASDARLETRAEPQPAVAAVARVRAAPTVAEPPPIAVAPPRATAPLAPVVQSQPAPQPVDVPSPPQGPPQVLIDRIEVITPAAGPPAPDPFLSLAARRVGASRHGGS
jgi:hypothetical protein